MKYVPNAVSQKLARQIILGKKHSPTILFGVGIAGVVISTVSACRSTLRLEGVLEETNKNVKLAKRARDEHPDDYSEQDYFHDVSLTLAKGAYKVVRLYGPAIVIGSLSVAALAGSHNILSKRNASLTAAFGALDKAFKTYRERVVEEFGEEKEREIRFGTAEREFAEDDAKGTKVTTVKTGKDTEASPYARVWDEVTANPVWDRKPEYNLMFLRAQEQMLNDKLRSRGHLFLNEVYETLCLSHTPQGAVCGWIYDTKDPDHPGDNYVSFGCFEDDIKINDFMNSEFGILLDFNVDGPIWDKI